MEQEVFTMLMQYGAAILGAIVAGAGAYLYRALILFIQSRLTAQQLELVQTQAALVVQAIEQTGLSVEWSSEQKKDVATVLVRKFTDKIGVSPDDDLIDIFIEAAVQRLNSEAGAFDKVIEE